MMIPSDRHASDDFRPDKSLFVYAHDPRKKFIHIVVKLKSDPKSEYRVLEELLSLNVEPIHTHTSIEKDRRRKNMSVLGESKDKIIIEDLKRKIESLPITIECHVNEDANGFITDKIRFPLTMNSESRVILVRQQGLSNVFSSLREGFGSGADVILFRQGYALGKDIIESIMQSTGEKYMRENFREPLSTYISAGWGRPEILSLSFEAHAARIRMYDNFECTGQKSDRPFSHFVRGDLCGFVSGAMQTKLNCEEQKCIAKGDEYCEFLLTKA